MEEKKIIGKVNYGFYIPTVLGILCLIPIGAFLISRGDNILGAISMLSGIFLFIGYFNLLMSEVFINQKN